MSGESVDAYAVGFAKNGEKGEQEWDGIVGFFHPFLVRYIFCDALIATGVDWK